jgi:hypothetical protein
VACRRQNVNTASFGLADESVCPTLAHRGLRLGGAGAFACQPIFSQTLRLRLSKGKEDDIGIP